MSFRSDKTSVVLPFPGGKPAAVTPPGDPPLPVLVVLHQETSQPGRVGNALHALGHELDIRRPRFGDPLPETLDEHAGAVIFGGPMSANDGDDYVRREIDWIDAKQLGARVAPHPQGRTEIGYYPIRPTAAGHALCPDWPQRVYHWHREGFELPHGTELLAEGDDFPMQAFQAGHAFGFQLHCWTTRGHDRMAAPGARERHQHFLDRAVHDFAERAWLKNFIGGWLARMPASIMSEAAE